MTNRMIIKDIAPLLGEPAAKAMLRLAVMNIRFTIRSINGELCERKRKNKPEDQKARLIINNGRLVGVEIW